MYYLLIVDAYSHLPVLLGLDAVTSQEVFRLLTVFQTMFRPSLEENIHPEVNAQLIQHIKTDAGSQFTSGEFVQLCLTASINVTFAAPKHQEINNTIPWHFSLYMGTAKFPFFFEYHGYFPMTRMESTT